MRPRPLLVVALALAACERPNQTPPPEPSPNASMVPAPLATAPPTGQPGVAQAGADVQPNARVEGSSAPSPMRPDQGLPADTLGAKESSGVALAAELRWAEVPQPPKGSEVHGEGLQAARKLTALRMQVSLGEVGRLRMVLDSRGFSMPQGTELRARADKVGHVLLFPGGTEYRAVAPGALRALFGDRRLDVTPLLPGTVAAKGNGPTRLGHPARRVDVSSKLGNVQLDLIKVPDAGLGAALLCRTLVELVGVDASAAVCLRDEVPARAVYTWKSGGSLTFEVQDVSAKKDFAQADLLCPPTFARYVAGKMPPGPSGVLLTRDEAAAFRTRPIDVGPAAKGAPGEGLIAKNATDGLRYVLIDGVPVAWVMPGVEQYVIGPPRGRYSVQWRSFLGDVVEPPQVVELPARVAIGEPRDPAAPPPAASK